MMVSWSRNRANAVSRIVSYEVNICWAYFPGNVHSQRCDVQAVKLQCIGATGRQAGE